MKQRIVLLVGCILLLTSTVASQDSTTQLLLLANNLRRSLGLGALTYNPALAAAANRHASWMAQTNRISHVQDDGSRARDRATAAGYPALRISEIIYLGASAQSAFNWWLNSPVHYAALTSPNYQHVGIGTVSIGQRRAFVMVFGSTGGSQSSASANSGGNAVPAAPPSYVLGLDEVGNIKHEVQPGHTIGDIALIYGYTWDDIPHMLDINGMTWDDIRLLQPGNVFLVPPQEGTFTPAPPVSNDSATATAAPTIEPTETAVVRSSTPAPAIRPTFSIRIAPVQSETAVPALTSASDESESDASNTQLILLGVAILVQLAVLGASAIAWLFSSR